MLTTNLAWFTSYLNGRKQYIKITESADTVRKDIKSGVPQGSILALLLFLLYVQDLPNSSNVLVPIMHAEDTLLFEYSNIKTLFKIVNGELIKVSDWFSANKLSLNTLLGSATSFPSFFILSWVFFISSINTFKFYIKLAMFFSCFSNSALNIFSIISMFSSENNLSTFPISFSKLFPISLLDQTFSTQYTIITLKCIK